FEYRVFTASTEKNTGTPLKGVGHSAYTYIATSRVFYNNNITSPALVFNASNTYTRKRFHKISIKMLHIKN
ncbi:MAG: hypothetical protein KAJ79_01215, partial [Candidatus Omnitrophica bacterium]|nr:hypothetical protein [Candidatus Omnitrophota bacterium]